MPTELVMAVPFNRCQVLASAKRREKNAEKQQVFSQAMVIMAFAEFTESIVKDIMRVWHRLDGKAAQKEEETATRLINEFIASMRPNPNVTKSVEACLHHVLTTPSVLNIKTALVALVPVKHKESFRASLGAWSKMYTERLDELINVRDELAHGRVYSETEIAENANLYLSDFSRIARAFKAAVKDRTSRVSQKSKQHSKEGRPERVDSPDSDYWQGTSKTLVSGILPKVKANSLPNSTSSTPKGKAWYLPKNNLTAVVHSDAEGAPRPTFHGPGKIKKLKPIKLKRGEGYFDSEPVLSEDPVESLALRSKRCKLWPDCYRGDRCPYIHPSKKCLDFPFCTFGTECLFVHPYCPERICENEFCPYQHQKPRRFHVRLKDAFNT